MDLTPYVESLRRELAVAASAGGEDARALGERLSASLDSATRLALLEALSAAADEITRELAPGAVDVRLRGREPEFVVTSPLADRFEAAGPPETAPRPPAADKPEEGGTTRITLRLPEHLKPHIDEAAGRDGLSVNAWLVRAVSSALEPAERSGRKRPSSGNRYTGWVR